MGTKTLTIIHNKDRTVRAHVYTWGGHWYYQVHDLKTRRAFQMDNGLWVERWTRDTEYWGLDESADFASQEEAIEHAQANALR